MQTLLTNLISLTKPEIYLWDNGTKLRQFGTSEVYNPICGQEYKTIWPTERCRLIIIFPHFNMDDARQMSSKDSEIASSGAQSISDDGTMAQDQLG